MKKWEAFTVASEKEAAQKIEQLVQEGYTKEDLSVLARHKKNQP